MPTLAARVDFAEKYVTNKEGAHWSLKGREWVRDEYWLPADGYKLWRPEGVEVCEACKESIGTIIEHPFDNVTRSPEHEHATDGCPGLDVFPTVVTLLNLIRQDGKTFNGMASDLADMGLNRNISIALIAASEDQVKTLFEENYVEAVRNSPRLARHFRQVGLRLVNDKTNSFIEALPASAKSVTGRTRRRVRIDEARDVPSKVAWAVIPAVQAMSGIECPRGHVSVIDPDGAMAMLKEREQKKCTACGERLQPFFGRVVAASSSGVTEDDEDFWFRELIEKTETEPSPFVHVFRSGTPLNPAKSPVVADALQKVFGELESMRNFVEADMTNRWTRKGEDFITSSELGRCIDRGMRNLDECPAPCVGFLDTSITTDKTSLVILAEDREKSTERWQHVYIARLDVWEPSQLDGGIIDDRVIKAHLDALLPLYTGLRVLHVDTRGMPWAIRMVKQLGDRRVRGWDKSTSHESVAGWSELQKRIRSQTIRLPDNEPMKREFRGLQLKLTPDGVKVVDRDRRKSHKDITEALALSCYLLALEAVKGSTSLASRRARQAKSAGEVIDRMSKTFGKLGDNSW